LKNVDSSRDLGTASDGIPLRCCRKFFLFFAVLMVIAPALSKAHARVHRSQSWVETQFDKAESQRQTLNGRAEQARTRREYETVIASYRRIVLEAPTSKKADASAFAVAQVTAEMGRHFKDDMALYSAVREYKYLRREYPGSKHRIEALLAIGEIYKNDLGDESDGRAAFEELLRSYPHSELAAEAKAELKAIVVNDKPSQHTAESADEIVGSQKPTEKKRQDESIRVTDVQYWSGPDYTRITVSLEQDVQFASQRISDPERIFFDLKNARLASVLMGQSYDVDDGLVKKIRVAQYSAERARIVVETARQASFNASVALNPPRLVIDIHNGDDETEGAYTSPDHGQAPKTSKSVRAGTPIPVQDASLSDSEDDRAGKQRSDATVRIPDQTPRKSPVTVATAAGVKKVIVDDDDDAPDARTKDDAKDQTSAPKTPARPTQRKSGRRVVAATNREAQPMSGGDRSLIRTLGLRIGKIVIDPGHGGHDTGTIGPNGLLEKDLVLDVSRRLGKLLGARLGAEVVFTRRDDTFIPLETRTSIANQESADLFVSVHANSSRDPDARGVETYYLNFTSSADALEVAARENAEADKSIHELQDLVKKIALKEKIEESKEFATDVQQSLHSGLAAKSSGVRDRGVKKAPFVVLIGANMPSILAEISFISNPGDEKRLKGPDYRQRIAESLYRGIARYINGLGGIKVASQLEKSSAN
jgi:N-acetylmuramoyl-L-alanine amidase